jgi:hypothetical protein
MSVHMHTMRAYCARALVLVPAPFLLGWAMVPESKNSELAQVSGRVTCADQPFAGLIFFLPDQQGGPNASGPLKPDGSFELFFNGRWDQRGAMPGIYRVVVRPFILDKSGSRVDSKFQDPRTTELRVNVGPDWNYVRFDLH